MRNRCCSFKAFVFARRDFLFSSSTRFISNAKIRIVKDNDDDVNRVVSLMRKNEQVHDGYGVRNVVFNRSDVSSFSGNNGNDDLI